MGDHTLYLLPGVATDRRVYRKLDLQGRPYKFLDWEEPLKGESISQYARRMADRIDPHTNPILVGYSFGGMVSIEMAKHIRPAATIILASIKHYHERPFQMWFTSSLRLNKAIPTSFGKRVRPVYSWLNEPRTREERRFIKTMARALCHRHTDWAVDQALQWRNADNIPRVHHIHGTRDRIFPIRYIRRCKPIQGGSHLMLLNKAPEISEHILRIVDKA